MSKWRDFKTDPPQDEIVMLVWIPRYSRHPLLASFYRDKVMGGDWGMENWTDVVTHWMPMPEPPESDK